MPRESGTRICWTSRSASLSGPVQEGLRSSRQITFADKTVLNRSAKSDLPDPAGPSTATTRLAPARGLAAARSDFVDATRLWAVSRRFFDEFEQTSWDPDEVERGLATARSVLGEANFDEAWRAGQELSRDQAVVLARRIAEQARTAAPAL